MSVANNAKDVLSRSIAAELEQEIIDGVIASGARLDETAIARRFGVSRTPVREALQSVVARSLAHRVPYRGVIVTDISPERIDQLFEAMGEIEALCAKFAAQRMTMEQRAALLQLHEVMAELVRAEDFKGYEATNTSFHHLIYTGSHNADFVQMAEMMGIKLAPFRRSQLSDRARMERSHSEHDQIVEAIIERDGVAAEKALRRHLLSAAQTMLDKWAQRQSVQ